MRRAFAGFLLVGAVLFGTLVPAGGSAGAQDATPAVCATTTEQENADRIARLFADVAAGTDVTSYYAENHTVHAPTGEVLTNVGPGYMMGRAEDYPDLSITIDQAIAQGDRVGVFYTWQGTQQGDDEQYGVAATGNEADWFGATFFRFECGAIAEVWTVSDNLGQFMDLGVITPEELQSGGAMATPAP